MDIPAVLSAAFQYTVVHCIFGGGRVRIDFVCHSDLISSGTDFAYSM